MNNLYLCGAEDKETLVVIDGWACREDRNFVELISAPSRGSARKIVSDTIWCGEFTTPMTIRKVGTTEEPTGIIRTKGKYFDYTDYYSDLWTKAWEKVGDSFDIPKRSS